MSDSYVTSQATIKCSCGDKCAKLTIYPDRTIFLTDKPMANISDHVSMYNIAPFGKCHTVAYPPTGSATAANHGHLTPMPCVPGTISEWINGKSDYIVKGKPALLKSSYCRCKWGGIITVTDDGQVDTGTSEISTQKRIECVNEKMNYQRILVSDYKPCFIYKEELKGEKAIIAKKTFCKTISDFFYEGTKMSNWLSSPVPNLNSVRTEENSNANETDSLSYTEIGQEGQILLKGGVSYNEYNYTYINRKETQPTNITDYGRLMLHWFDAIPLIRNTKASLKITIDASVAGFTLIISVGIDGNLRRYIQLEIRSWIGGDYKDFVDFLDYKKNKKFTKRFKMLEKKFSKRFINLIQIKPSYQTGVKQPIYDWLECGAFAKFNLKIDKILDVKIGTNNVQSINDIWENTNIDIAGKISLPKEFEVEYGWKQAERFSPNFGFFCKINGDNILNNIQNILKDDYSRPIGLSRIEEEKSKDIFDKSIYKDDKDNELTAKMGSCWSYTWQLENLLEEYG